MVHLKPVTDHYQRLKERLSDAYPDIDALTLENTLEGMTSLHEALETIIRQFLDDEAICEALKGRIADASERLVRIQNRARNKREAVRDCMIEAEISSIQAADFTATIRAGVSSLKITDETQIKAEFWEPQAPKLSRARLLKALKAGQSIDGVNLSNPQPALSVRVK
ncbi:MAG: siphovirus Gp157 family protein [Hyphomicrobiaceae bacterium]|nr:siphovirus Gp157 family protein [Hyphomicrobiaceae bacterium]